MDMMKSQLKAEKRIKLKVEIKEIFT